MSDTLPSQCEYPEFLYRVTSTITYKRSLEPYTFLSPASAERKLPVEPSDEFPSRQIFERTVRHHFSAQRDLSGFAEFTTQFVSATTSFRYAVSVAELHAQRGGKNITITTIHYKSLAYPRPMWNAYEVALQSNVANKKEVEDARNEYLVYGRIEGDEDNSVTVQYSDIEPYVSQLMPALRELRRRNNKHQRFCSYLEGSPVEAYLPAFQDGDDAHELATLMAPKQILLPVMTSLLLLQCRELTGDPILHKTIANLVADKANDAELDVLAHYAEIATDSQHGLRILEFTEAQYVPAEGSTTSEMTDLYHCLFRLRRALHIGQDRLVADRLDGLSTTAVILRQYLNSGSIVDALVRHHVEDSTMLWYQSIAGSKELSGAFVDLTRTVQKAIHEFACTRPLSRLADCLKEASDEAKAASQLDGYDEVRHWSVKLREALDRIEGRGEQLRLPILQARACDMWWFKVAAYGIGSEESTSAMNESIMPVVERKVAVPRGPRRRRRNSPRAGSRFDQDGTREYGQYGWRSRQQADIFVFGSGLGFGARLDFRRELCMNWYDGT